MGAFYLFDPKSGLDVASSRRVFALKGLSTVREFELGDLRLLLYQKTCVDETNYYLPDSSSGIFCVGTPVYRGLNYSETLRAVLSDARSGILDWEKLRGSFTFVIWSDARVRIGTDFLNTQPVFTDTEQRAVSSSFLAILASLPGRQTINSLAFLEKLSAGYIVGPETLVESVIKVTDSLQRSWRGKSWTFLAHPARQAPERKTTKPRSQCLGEQVSVLRSYFSDIRALGDDQGSVLGLSAGYDSRLLMALAESVSFPLVYQTHCTRGSHDGESAIVASIVKHFGGRLICIPSKPMWAQEEHDLEGIIRDSFYLFDARNSYDMGAFSETYTSGYSAKTLGDCGLRLNGLGGEIYRNYCHSALPRVNCYQWMLQHVYYAEIRQVVTERRLLEQMHRNKTQKMSAAVGVDFTSSVDQWDLRRYYGEIRMPECCGSVNNAQNQVSFYLTPFMEWSSIKKAYEALPFIGVSGRFEAKMIQESSAYLAGAPSHYGFPLDREPVVHRIKSAMKGFTPDVIANHRVSWGLKRGWLGPTYVEQYEAMRREYRVMREIEDALRSFFPELEWGPAFQGSTCGPNTVALGSFLREFSDKLRR
jgi:hypothetical protein